MLAQRNKMNLGARAFYAIFLFLMLNIDALQKIYKFLIPLLMFMILIGSCQKLFNSLMSPITHLRDLWLSSSRNWLEVITNTGSKCRFEPLIVSMSNFIFFLEDVATVHIYIYYLCFFVSHLTVWLASIEISFSWCDTFVA